MLMKLPPLLLVCLITVCATLLAHADSGRLVLTPSWEYQFPPGLLDSANAVTTADFRYLAIANGRWSYHPVGKPDSITIEGENAVYLLDLMEKRLVWKQVFPEGLAVFVSGISPAGEFVAVKLGQGWHGSFQFEMQGERNGQQVEGIRVLGTPEPGMRLYDRRGALAASRLPLRLIGARQPCGPLVPLTPQDGQVAPSEELRQTLAEAGIQEAAALPARGSITRRSRDGAGYVVGLEADGSVKWEWRVPPGEGLVDSREEPLRLSPDGQYGLASYLVPPPKAGRATRSFHFFRWTDGWRWSQELPLENPGHLTWEVSGEARSLVIVRQMPESYAVDMLGQEARPKVGSPSRGSRLAPVGYLPRALTGPLASPAGPRGREWTIWVGPKASTSSTATPARSSGGPH